MSKAILKYWPFLLVGWIGLTIAGVMVAGKLGPRLDYTYTTPGEPGYEANLKITQRFGIDPAFESMLATLDLPPGISMATPAGQALAARTFAAAYNAGPVTVADYANTRNPLFILDGGRAALALISIPNPDYGPGAGVEPKVEPALKAATPSGATLSVTGFAQMLSNAGPNASNLLEATIVGALLALGVLFFVYGSPIAILPIIMAIPAITVTFLAIYGLTFVASVSYFVQAMVVLLSLGISIDFSLIIVNRWREEREAGRANRDAVLATIRTAGGAVALSGVTAAVGLLSLVVLPVPFLRTIGYAGALIPFVAFAVAVTLLPIMLLFVGPALDRFSFRRGATITYSIHWERWGRFVLRHRWAAAVSGLAILAVATLPVLSMKTGEPRIASLAQSGPAADAFHRLERSGLPAAIDFPIYVMAHGGAAGASAAVAIAQTTPGVHAALAPIGPSFRRGDDALLIVIAKAEGNDAAGKATVSRLRERLANLPGGADVGGSTAEDMAFTHAVYGSFPLLLAVVAAVTFVILMAALRSVVLAFKAVLLNIVSLGAAYGFMIFFWQLGHGSDLVYGMQGTGAIRAWIPSVVFACLFGLSMDYEVFLLSRIREEYDRTGSTEEAVAIGLARTGRLVTCAAVILMVTFLSLSIDPNQLVKIIATTLAAGVLMDAIVIRTLLVPALVALMGRWNWWAPAWLARRGDLATGHAG